MAHIRVIGEGMGALAYVVEIDGVARPDVTKLVLTYEANNIVTANVTLLVESLDVAAELSEAEAADMARRMRLMFAPASKSGASK